jgi:NhaP-type Na+/H+ or K+/H+ antiporter
VFEFSTYHLGFTIFGLGLILAYWLPRFVSGREPAASALLILAGCGAGLLLPDLTTRIDPRQEPALWEHVSELALIIGLFGTGLRIDRLVSWVRLQPTIRLLVVGMPISIAVLAVLGWGVLGMTLAGALLLGAVMAPTDPVLAGDVQVGPPLEGGEHPVRFTLTAEAGLNDGLAFPFVYLALAIGGVGALNGDLLGKWAAIDVGYRTCVGACSGIALGWLLGKLMFDYPRESPLAKTEAGVVAAAGVLVCYGITELLEGYGFVATFLAGVTLRRSEAKHQFHRTLHSFTDTVEHALTDVLLLAVGVVAPLLLRALTWREAAVGIALIFVVRPFAGWVSLMGTNLRGRERLVVAFYGVRGIGSIYYIAFATGHLHLANQDMLWALAVFVIFASTVVHGLTAGIAVERVTGEVLKGAEASSG